MKRSVCLFLLLTIVLSVFTSCGDLQRSQKYNEALELIDSGDYAAAREILIELGDYKDAKTLLGNFRYVLLTLENNSTAANGEPLQGGDTSATYTDDGLLSTWTRGKERFEYVYDDNKKLIKELCSNGEGTWVNCEYAYDEKGNLVKETYYSGDMPISGFKYTYDDRGNIIQKAELYNKYGDLHNLQTRISYDFIYDDNNRLISSVTAWSEGSQNRVDYVYDENGRLIRKEKPTDGGAVTIVEYTYDEKGNLLKEANDSHVVEYTYDDNNNLIKHQKYDANYTSAIRYVYEYTYDESGLLIKEEYVGYSNSETKITTTFTYDESGNLTKKYKESRKGTNVNKFTYVYDTNGNVIEYVNETSSGLVYASKMTYKLVYIPYKLHERIESLINPTFN